MDLNDLDPEDLIYILDCLRAYMAASDAVEVHEDADAWMFKLLLQGPAKDTLPLRVKSPEKVSEVKQGKFTTFSDMVDYLLETYASKDGIDEAKGNLRSLV